MHIVRRAAYQGHAIPSKAGYSRGPFNPEVLAEPVIEHSPEPPQEMPYGATAQNGYRGVPLFRCRLCGGVETEDSLDTHYCPEPEDG